MNEITVKLPQNSYQITIGPGSLDQIGDRIAKLNLGRKVLLISNPEIFRHYGKTAIASIEAAGFEVYTHLIGAFYQPKLVAIDPNVLKTLPK